MIIPKSVLLLKSQIPEQGLQDKYEALLNYQKFEVRKVKTLAFDFKNLEKLKEKLENPDKYSGLILSSPRCVQAIELSMENSDFPRQWTKKDNFAVGETTFGDAFDKLLLVCRGQEAGNAENLCKVILDTKTNYPKPFLYPHGNLKSDTFSLEMAKAGLGLEGIEVYDTIANPNIEQQLSEATNNFQSISEFVVFFSPSGLNSCIDLLQRVPVDLNHVKLIAIGPVTELAIKERNLKVHGTAKRPNPEELLNVILN